MSLKQKLRHQTGLDLTENEVIKIPTINLEHAGQLNLKELYDNGFRAVLYDLHHTIAHFGTSILKRPVMRSIAAQNPASTGLKFAIGSNGLSEKQVHNAAKEFKEMLGLDEVFAITAGVSSNIRPKSDPQMVFIAAEHLGVSPSEIIIVGDQESDREVAINSGAGAFALCRMPGKIEQAKIPTYKTIEKLGRTAVEYVLQPN
jgi:beta-phosphoglucomutase-like phosphatase (HAD superfamily)